MTASNGDSKLLSTLVVSTCRLSAVTTIVSSASRLVKISSSTRHVSDTSTHCLKGEQTRVRQRQMHIFEPLSLEHLIYRKMKSLVDIGVSSHNAVPGILYIICITTLNEECERVATEKFSPVLFFGPMSSHRKCSKIPQGSQIFIRIPIVKSQNGTIRKTDLRLTHSS